MQRHLCDSPFCRNTGVALSIFACAAFAVTVNAADLRAIYTEIPGSPSNLIPGARDLAGQPVTAHWTAIGDVAVRVQADEWVVRGFTDLGDDLLWILVRGNGTTGTMFMQEGQPVEGGGAGEVWDFFVDSPPVAWNAAGLMGYSARARGGLTTDNEKVGLFDGTSHTIILTQGSPVTGLANGCNALGNSIGSLDMLNTGDVAFGNTPVSGCSSALFYPALFRGSVGVMQNNVTPITVGNIGEEVVDGFSYDGAAFSPDGLHYAIPVTTNNPSTAIDRILLIDNAAVLREGSPIVPASDIIMADVLDTSYGPDGTLYVRGDEANDDDWALRDGELIAATGLPITTGNFELWGNIISRLKGNSTGEYVIVGNTNNADVNLDTVIVRSDEEVLAREGDPVDVDGDGQYDDDAFVRTIGATALTDAGVLYFVGTLRNAAGVNLGDAFIRAGAGPACVGDTDGSGAVDVDDLITVILGWGPCGKSCPGDVDGNSVVDVDDLIAVILNWGSCA